MEESQHFMGINVWSFENYVFSLHAGNEGEKQCHLPQYSMAAQLNTLGREFQEMLFSIGI